MNSGTRLGGRARTNLSKTSKLQCSKTAFSSIASLVALNDKNEEYSSDGIGEHSNRSKKPIIDSPTSSKSSPTGNQDSRDALDTLVQDTTPIDLKTAERGLKYVDQLDMMGSFSKWEQFKALAPLSANPTCNSLQPLHNLLLNSNLDKRLLLSPNLFSSQVNLNTFPSALTTQLNLPVTQPAAFPFSSIVDVMKKSEGCTPTDWSPIFEHWQGKQAFVTFVPQNKNEKIRDEKLQPFFFLGSFYLNLCIISTQHARAQPTFALFPKATQDFILQSNWYQLVGLHLSTLGIFTTNALLSTNQFAGPRSESTFSAR